MNTPTFSVVMPVYNVEAFVGEAIQSVLAQTFTDFELIIVDDGSHDRSMDICRTFTDERIRVVTQRNRGLAGARNSGIAVARGDYVALLDSDDRWDTAKLSLHYIHLRADESVDVSYSGSRLIDAAGRPLGITQQPRLTGVAARHILTRNPIGNGSAPVIRRRALDAALFVHPQEPGRLCWFDESFRQSEDIELWLRLIGKHGCHFEGIDGLLTDYRIVTGGLSANVIRQYESWERAITKAQEYAPALLARYGARARAYQLRYLARRAVQLGDGSFAVALMRQALAASPWIALQEPVKTLETSVGALAARWLSRETFNSLLNRRLGSEVAA
ncbi:glycosyltransferase family 2 protein [Salinicola aestuarinus]|uniref:glycosyltransferase family 2 protein n=1 Tax=Salinicola aestuarinus TaxID=1949082 RepID=UPI000DA19430|nr:glycosyltransferase [Salinicola aestuarinus]